jgi:hypothetical protein
MLQVVLILHQGSAILILKAEFHNRQIKQTKQIKRLNLTTQTKQMVQMAPIKQFKPIRQMLPIRLCTHKILRIHRMVSLYLLKIKAFQVPLYFNNVLTISLIK